MDREIIGKAILERRTALGLTLRQAAPKCGVSYATLAQIEKGQINCTMSTLQGVADGLGLALDVEIGLDPVPHDREPVASRFRRVLPHIPAEELDVFIHELALWERRYAPAKPKT